MKKIILLLLVVTVTLFVGCMSTEKENDESYQFIFSNIDDNDAIKSYLEKEQSRGNDINDTIKNGDTVLMIAARFTTNIEVIKTITSYYPDIHKMNRKSDMSALDYLKRREGTEEMYNFLIEESVKHELKKKADSAAEGLVKGIFKKF